MIYSKGEFDQVPIYPECPFASGVIPPEGKDGLALYSPLCKHSGSENVYCSTNHIIGNFCPKDGKKHD